MRLLGCWYSNNLIHPKIMDASLASITRAKGATNKADVEVRTCTWKTMPGSPFPGYVTHFKMGIHLGIVIQILKTVYEEDRAGRDYDAMAFLEHDVVYPHDYFDRVAAAFQADPSILGVSNLDYIGVNQTGWVQVHTRHEPMHQLSMRYGAARLHFESVLRACILDGAALLEPQDKSSFVRLPFGGEKPSAHMNHTKHFTTHFKIYESDSHGLELHPYWGDFRNYYPEEERSLA